MVVEAVLVLCHRLVMVARVAPVVRAARAAVSVVRAATRGLCSVLLRPVVPAVQAVMVLAVQVVRVEWPVGMAMVGPAVRVALVPGVASAVVAALAVCSWVMVALVALVGMPPVRLVMAGLAALAAIRVSCRGVAVVMAGPAARVAWPALVVMAARGGARD